MLTMLIALLSGATGFATALVVRRYRFAARVRRALLRGRVLSAMRHADPTVCSTVYLLHLACEREGAEPRATLREVEAVLDELVRDGRVRRVRREEMPATYELAREPHTRMVA